MVRFNVFIYIFEGLIIISIAYICNGLIRYICDMYRSLSLTHAKFYGLRVQVQVWVRVRVAGGGQYELAAKCFVRSIKLKLLLIFSIYSI